MRRLRETGERREAEVLDLCLHPGELIAGRLDQATVGGVRNRLQQNEITQALEKVDREASRVVAGIDEALDGGEQRGAVTGGERVDGVVDQGDVGDAEQRECTVVGDAPLVGTGEQLIEDGKRVTRGPATGADHQREHLGGDGDALPGTDPLEQPAHHRRREQAERIVVRPRADGGQDLLRLRRREDEDQMLRRLFHNLEQGVESRGGDHVRLVDDEHAIPRFTRRVEGTVAEFTGVVDAAVAGRVELDDIEIARPTGPQRDT